eukprot:jgi/Picsp_1/4516/NSC_06737-R1_---NA---
MPIINFPYKRPFYNLSLTTQEINATGQVRRSRTSVGDKPAFASQVFLLIFFPPLKSKIVVILVNDLNVSTMEDYISRTITERRMLL